MLQHQVLDSRSALLANINSQTEYVRGSLSKLILPSDVVSLLMKRELVFLDIDADTFEFTAILLLSNWAMYCTGSRLADGCACRIDSPKV